MTAPDFDKARQEAAGQGMPDMGGDLVEVGINMNEMFESMKKGGFTPSQALYLTGCLATGNPGIPPPR